MDIVSFWVIASVFITHLPTYNNQTIPTENRVILPIPYQSKKDCDKMASAMFKNMKKEEAKDSPQKLNSISCIEQFKIVYNDRSIQNRTQGNGNRTVPDS